MYKTTQKCKEYWLMSAIAFVQINALSSKLYHVKNQFGISLCFHFHCIPCSLEIVLHSREGGPKQISPNQLLVWFMHFFLHEL